MAPLLTRCEERDYWRTPKHFFERISDEFGGFELDAAATHENALCLRYFTEEDNSLIRDWNGKVWCNPPYSDIEPWMRKGHEEVERGRADLVVFLVPVRTGTRWFHDYANRHTVRFLRGRLKFNDGRVNAPFDCCLVIMRKVALA